MFGFGLLKHNIDTSKQSFLLLKLNIPHQVMTRYACKKYNTQLPWHLAQLKVVLSMQFWLLFTTNSES